MPHLVVPCDRRDTHRSAPEEAVAARYGEGRHQWGQPAVEHHGRLGGTVERAAWNSGIGATASGERGRREAQPCVLAPMGSGPRVYR
jgi:hypothetical protein